MGTRLHVRSLAAVALVFALASCTVTFEPLDPASSAAPSRPVERPQAAIAQFVPDRGVSSTYRIGEPIAFQIRTREDGFVTLTAIDPDGSVYVFARNIEVRGGRTNVINGLGPRQRFVITAPEGLHRVTAHFTPRRTEEAVTFRGVVGYDNWQARIRIELQPYPTGGIAETRFLVRR
jgi:hypothetical protein